MPQAMWPMLQTFHPEAIEGVYSLAGFRDRGGRHFAVLGANKLLQRPRTMGVGLCFEGAPVDPALASALRALLERIGYFGVFEVEFIRTRGRSLLIDFNPRFYNQLALDIAGGLALPQLVHAAAVGDDERVDRLVQAAHRTRDVTARAFCNGFSLRVMLGAQRVFGAMSREEVARWRRWSQRDGGVDAIADRDDPLPYAAEIARQLLEYATNPRLFWRVHRARRDTPLRAD
jgi:D-aspartate ligase